MLIDDLLELVRLATKAAHLRKTLPEDLDRVKEANEKLEGGR